MAHRFFVNKLPDGDQGILGGDQARHASQVMRFQSGDRIILFDGQGEEVDCEIVEVSKKELRLSVIERRQVDRALKTDLTLAVALPKGDRQKVLVEKLVELGVNQLVPLKSSRSVAVANEKVIARIEKQVIEACKQCERNRLMAVTPALDLVGLAAWAKTEFASARLLIGDPYEGETIAAVAATGESSNGGQAFVIAIGPEGGFSDEEIASAVDQGFEKLRVGPTVLRVETAAIAAAAILGAGREF